MTPIPAPGNMGQLAKKTGEIADDYYECQKRHKALVEWTRL